jgi:hypothetical protein
MNGLNGLRRETGGGAGDTDDIRLGCGDRGCEIFPGIWKSRGIDDLNLDALSLKIGA